jgi:very-short-patch-repair endonuclease
VSVRRKLRQCGYRVLRVWEHELNEDLRKVAGRISQTLTAR